MSNALSERAEHGSRRAAEYFVYMRILEDGQIYVGITRDLARRNAEHRTGKGCRTTLLFGAGDIIFAEKFPSLALAVTRERQLKRWRRAKKLALAAGRLDVLKLL